MIDMIMTVIIKEDEAGRNVFYAKGAWPKLDAALVPGAPQSFGSSSTDSTRCQSPYIPP